MHIYIYIYDDILFGALLIECGFGIMIRLPDQQRLNFNLFAPLVIGFMRTRCPHIMVYTNSIHHAVEPQNLDNLGTQRQSLLMR